MNVDELRRTLHEPPAVGLSVEVDEIVARGRRRRRIRRAAVPAAVAAVAIAVGVPAVVVGARPDSVPGPGQGTAAVRGGTRVEPTSPPWSSHPPTPGPGECPVLSGTALDTLPPCGAVIRTGEATKGGERVFWFAGLDRPGYLSLQEGRPVAGGVATLSSIRVDAATFSAVGPLDTGGPGAAGLYGAVRGDVRRLVVATGGRTVEARLVPWNVDRRLAVWWAADPRYDQVSTAVVVATAYGPGDVMLATVRLGNG